MLLGVNIDHIAVLREARLVNDPDILHSLSICEEQKVDQITIHLREDRRHIQDVDVQNIMSKSKLPVNIECSINSEIIDIMIHHRPKRVTLVPENRAEVTTEGGLDLLNNFDKINLAVQKLNKNGIDVSLFIDPTHEMVELSKKLSVQWCEFHTGRYANIFAMLHTDISQTKYSVKEFELPKNELEILLKNSIDDLNSSVDLAYDLGLNIAAGHGLNYKNLEEILKIKKIQELNIGQSIIARSIYTGLQTAIKDIKKMINEA